MTGSNAVVASADAVTLDTSLKHALGQKAATVLGRAFGMATVADLLGHYPRDYAHRAESTNLRQLPAKENVTIIAEVLSVSHYWMKGREGSVFRATITDGRDELVLIFFNKKSQEWREDKLHPGARGIFAGQVSVYKKVPQLAHPQYKTFKDEMEEAALTPMAKQLLKDEIPIYAATGTVPSWKVREYVNEVLETVSPLPEPIPPFLRERHGLLSHADAIERIHRPGTEHEWRQARETLRFTEAWVLQCALVQQHAAARTRHTRARQAVPGGFLDRFDAALPFVLTADQNTVAAEITADLALSSPMNRLVQGEVGSGKTVVALRAMLAVADSGGQTAFLAPTEVLAGQHLRSITAMLGPFLSAELMPTLLTGKLPVAQKRKALLSAVSGQSRIVIGTHALLSDHVAFFDLGLVIVDEQHRFGVAQREALRLKGAAPPHVLVLTATPIPRTIAMTVFGDLDVSTIRMLPAGRQGITSVVVPLSEQPGWFLRIWNRLAEELALGRQAFVVCPAIAPKEVEETEEGAEVPPPEEEGPPLTNVESLLERLRVYPPLAAARIEALHGRMTGDEKDRTMQAFAAGEIDVLVATTVIEVGVDVPNASAMVVMDADRFGVSQLHQLRGRVGRGGVPGLCLLVTVSKAGSSARTRIEAVAGTLDGFQLAQFDLEQRQEGNVLGDTQSGERSALRFLRVATDGDVIEAARDSAVALIDADPDIRTIPALREAVRRRLDEQERTWLTKG